MSESATAICPQCEMEFVRRHKSRKYCTPQCLNRAYHERRQAEGRSLNRTRYERTCDHCGTGWSTVNRTAKYCSQACISRATAAQRAEKAQAKPKRRMPAAQCAWCLALHFTTRKYCGSDCERSALIASARNLRSPLRVAYEAGDGDGLIVAVRKHCDTNDAGCWVWTRKSKDGYPVVRIAGKYRQVHRLVIEAKHGASLGSQHAHHTCANSLCVNPEHLQPVTHRENIAEMMARQSYLSRIAELEAALAEVAPGHPALRVIPVA